MAEPSSAIGPPMAKTAVIVPDPEMVAVVLADVWLANVIEPVFEFHEEKVLPPARVADIGRDPAFSQTFEPEGVVVPPLFGESTKVTWY